MWFPATLSQRHDTAARLATLKGKLFRQRQPFVQGVEVSKHND
jgi:hypothetical protein